MSYDKSIFAKSTGASLGVLAVIAMVVMSTGMAYALPIAGLGGFKISATQINGESLNLYPGNSQMSGSADGGSVGTPGSDDQSLYPTAVIELESTTIVDLALVKNFSLEELNAGLPTNPIPAGASAQLKITAGDSGTPVTSDNILLKSSQLQADQARFNGLGIFEYSSSTNNPLEQAQLVSDQDGARYDVKSPLKNQQGNTWASWSGVNDSSSAGPGVQLSNPDIKAHYLLTSQIRLPNLQLGVRADLNGDGTFEFGGGF